MDTHPRGAPHQHCLTHRSIAIVSQRQSLADGDGWRLGLVYIIITSAVAAMTVRKKGSVYGKMSLISGRI